MTTAIKEETQMLTTAVVDITNLGLTLQHQHQQHATLFAQCLPTRHGVETFGKPRIK